MTQATLKTHLVAAVVLLVLALVVLALIDARRKAPRPQQQPEPIDRLDRRRNDDDLGALLVDQCVPGDAKGGTRVGLELQEATRKGAGTPTIAGS